jgi:hypothetical protein
MESDVNGVLVAAITVPAIVLICVFAVVSAVIMFRLYEKKKTSIDITNPATETGTLTEFSPTNHTKHDSQDMAVDVAPNEAYGVTSANTQMTVCSTDKGCGESVYQTNVAYGIYGVTSANTQMTVCSTDKGCGESVYQTNVAYGIAKPATETGTSAEFSLTHHTEHDSQDMAIDVAPNEAYGVTIS